MKAAVLIDGGHLRVLARKAKLKYDPDFIESIAHSCVLDGEELLRILYYDCAPFTGTVKLPISGTDYKFEGSDIWLRELASKDYFAIRRGVLKFRGFKPKKVPLTKTPLKDEDFKPDFEQKGVDMRIGLDIANHSALKSVDRIILMTGDTDCIPAMKHARINGIQIVLVTFENHRIASELTWHADFKRELKLPTGT